MKKSFNYTPVGIHPSNKPKPEDPTISEKERQEILDNMPIYWNVPGKNTAYEMIKYWTEMSNRSDLLPSLKDDQELMKKKLQRYKEELTKKYGRYPTDEELKKIPYSYTPPPAKENKNIFKKLGNLLKKIASAPLVLALAPFKGAMKKALDKKKINYGSKLSEVATKFYDNVVRKANYEGYEEHYYEFNADEEKKKGGGVGGVIGGIVGAIAGTFVAPGAGTAAGAAGGKIAFEKLVPAIIEFFTMIFRKKEDNKATKSEIQMVALN
jgi:hypothetical protein